MSAHDEFRRAMIDLDVAALRLVWRKVYPDQVQPKDDAEALAWAHIVRLQAETMPTAARLYSYSWLQEHGYPTDIPVSLSKHRDYVPKIVMGSVGISVGFPGTGMTPENSAVRSVMEYAVLETYADGHKDQPHIVKARMMEARAREKRGLGLP